MNLITRFELAGRSVQELQSLRRALAAALSTLAPESAERRAALASLGNVDAELRARAARPFAPSR